MLDMAPNRNDEARAESRDFSQSMGAWAPWNLEQESRLRAGAAAARGFRPPRGSASCSNTRARYIRAPHKLDPLGRNPFAATSFATAMFPELSWLPPKPRDFGAFRFGLVRHSLVG